MILRILTASALLTLLPANIPAQSPPAPAFEIADVHPSPRTLYPFPRSTVHAGVFTMRQASMVDLIAKAYSVDADRVLGGPSWLETDHFDIYARLPPKGSPADVKPMLRSLLAERFKLVLHTDMKPIPAYLLTVNKGGPKMTESDGTASPDCRFVDPPQGASAGTVQTYEFACKNTSIESLVEDLRQWAGDYLVNPVADRTGLKATYDFTIKFHPKRNAARAGADGITIFDAVEKQLGLKLELKTEPLPAMVVDSASETPTPNRPDLAAVFPPPPVPEFEVATVRVSAPDAKMGGRVDGGQVSLQAGTMKFMLTFAYDVTDEMIVGGPKWIDSDHFDINAKASSNAAASQPGAPQMDPDDLRIMMRQFLAERFALKVHMEDRPLEAYTLVAVNPKLKKADPANRTGCKEGPGADGKDPRIANPILGRLLTCRNMSMTQFAAILQTQANGYIHTPVLDATKIDGAYDFTLSFSSAGQLTQGSAGPGTPGGDAGAGASEPNGALSLADAISRQMGLKLEKGKRPVPSLVIDHIDEKPTEN